MFDSDADSVEKNKDDNEPVEPLRFYGMSDPESKSLLGSPKTNAGTFVFHPRLEV